LPANLSLVAWHGSIAAKLRLKQRKLRLIVYSARHCRQPGPHEHNHHLSEVQLISADSPRRRVFMRTSRLAVGLAAVAAVACSAALAPAAQRPNVVVVLIDDMGWSDLSCFGGAGPATENIDRLAAEGVRFTQFYVNSPICSPSRVAITTGQYPQRWRITSYLNNRQDNARRGMAQWLEPAAPVLARQLQRSGYATGHFGKWHLGGQRDVDDAPPIADYGFDRS